MFSSVSTVSQDDSCDLKAIAIAKLAQQSIYLHRHHASSCQSQAHIFYQLGVESTVDILQEIEHFCVCVETVPV